MPGKALALPGTHGRGPKWAHRLAPLLFVAVSVAYFAHGFALAAAAPWWMDEVLSLWTARRPGLLAIWNALQLGSEFTPPLYSWLLHGLIQSGVTAPEWLRLPSLIAIWCAALAIAALVKRRSSWPVGFMAGAVVLSSGLFAYAVQARPYAMVTMLFALALLLWDRLPDRPRPIRHVLPLAAVLAIMTGFHFYAVLLVLVIPVAELLCRSMAGKRVRWSVLVASVAAMASILLWWPIMQAASAYNGQDVHAAAYYARPILPALARTYFSLGGGLDLVLLCLAAALVLRFGPRARNGDDAMGLLALLLLLVPVGVFLFALVVSHSYSDRYALAVVLGKALLAGWIAMRSGRHAVLVAIAGLALLLGGGALLRQDGELAKQDRLAVLSLVRQTPTDLPIVTADGLRFFEIMANSPPAIARRLVFLQVPGIVADDPTNRHQVERWKVIDPGLPVVDARDFLCANPEFLMLFDPSGSDISLPRWLSQTQDTPLPALDRPTLTRVRSGPCMHQ